MPPTTQASNASQAPDVPTFTSPFGAPIETTSKEPAPPHPPQRRMSQSEIASQRQSAAMLLAIQNRTIEEDEDDF
ncbi:hypothetical protein CcaverHIS002_0510290 [Cutaneotrichosporon cavernicola]|uniref:Uncharacterized protein n=1 Tax=Cutaneotrichosporon cavernicola TaxID=279322 RepID=A0AA48L7Q9_9TREE|nr:uncharacterized protein CcaverHIS019_0510850 [Cutaneotrichosporon cavernicola]BEI85628.1 hypothetical protein CcaverHIS002_0510290 [Cutaneotrichosporon cavernicola]BEI93457.1 hypothetical protein CcaverHIS019_0510850 [Cutaneotrichosporon cavernicola]BEJ01235.1 hypothetical protein CcaverHIS631_0510920 [Cutaneotrichosporon cavernicola]BEJ09004.1 hypothetical protein CcaverHIS641_0510980 [Cutaneotrichosporon cavernicola]